MRYHELSQDFRVTLHWVKAMHPIRLTIVAMSWQPKPQTEKTSQLMKSTNRAIDPCLLQFYVNNFNLIFSHFLEKSNWNRGIVIIFML